MSDDLMRLVYLSRMSVVDDPRWEIDNILRASHINNKRTGVTGALIFDRGDFGQVLEGSTQALRETFRRIRLDVRHFRVTVIELCSIEERAFSDWSMGFHYEPGPNPFAPGWAVPGDEAHHMTAGGAFKKLLDAVRRDELRNRAA